jgi:hypothetical protein
MRYEVRAMSFGEILDAGFRLVRNHFTLLVGMAAVLYIPAALVSANTIGQPAAAASVPTVLMVLTFGLVFIVISPVVAAGITYAVGEVYLGRTPTISQCLRFGFSILLPLVGTTLLWFLALDVGFVLFIIPGIYLALAFLLIWQVMVLERVFGLAALRRSRELMRDNLLRGFGVLFVAGLIYLVIGGAFQLLIGFIPLIGPIGSGLAQAVGAAYTSAVSVVLYFDIRCRKEAFEVQHLAQLVGGQAPAWPPNAA